jgi:hypothetical protein
MFAGTAAPPGMEGDPGGELGCGKLLRVLLGAVTSSAAAAAAAAVLAAVMIAMLPSLFLARRPDIFPALSTSSPELRRPSMAAALSGPRVLSARNKRQYVSTPDECPSVLYVT